MSRNDPQLTLPEALCAPAWSSPCGLDPKPEEASALGLAGRAREALGCGRRRLAVLRCGVFLGFTAIAVKLCLIGLGTAAGDKTGGLGTQAAELEIPRAEIHDRNGAVLATSVTGYALYADKVLLHRPETVAKKLAPLLPEVDVEKLHRDLTSPGGFAWVAREISPSRLQQVLDLGLPGIRYKRESKRIYPKAAATAHVIGGTSVDEEGIAGLELTFDEALRGSDTPLRLTLDLRLQHLLGEELRRAMRETRAAGAAGVILDAKTGEVLSLVSEPGFDPHRLAEVLGAVKPGREADSPAFNRATKGLYELGSVFKILTAGMALQDRVVGLADGFDATKPIRVDGLRIADYRGKHRWLTVPEIVKYSSNIGAAQMGLAVGKQAMQLYLDALGLLAPASVELPEVGHPLLPPRWTDSSTATIAFGHGINVSPLQLASAVAAAVNGGVYYPPTLVESDEPRLGIQVFSPKVSRSLRWMLRQVVLDGSGRRADAKGYLVGGKTGSAEKVVNGGYVEGKLISSFVGAFPIDEPRFVVYALLDEPAPLGPRQSATGGLVAAPLVGRIVERMGALLGEAPLAEIESASVDANLTPRGLGRLLLASHSAH